jgi:hypothetical protein
VQRVDKNIRCGGRRHDFDCPIPILTPRATKKKTHFPLSNQKTNSAPQKHQDALTRSEPFSEPREMERWEAGVLALFRVRVLCYQAAISMRCVSRLARAEFACFTRLGPTGGTADLLCRDFAAFHDGPLCRCKSAKTVHSCTTRMTFVCRVSNIEQFPNA